MDFFDQQDRARRHTKWLVVYFSLGVAALILAIYLAVLVIFVGLQSRRHRHYTFDERPQLTLWHRDLLFGVTFGTLAVITLGSLFKTAELARGGSAVANMLGGRLVSPTSTNPDERRLLNVVEEMALAAGIPVPQVFLLPEEKGINAFAAGHSTSDAVVAVTGGALRLLTRDELQGVIGHEFSHILNGDMRLNLRLMGIIFGLVCLAVIGRILLQVRAGRSSRDRNALPLFGLALLVIGWAGVFFGRLIQAAVSRQREFLADASSVQFTRNPAALAGALKKIGGLSYGSRLIASHAEEASHLFFGNGMGESFMHVMDTHPPLAERIKAIDPTFDGIFPRVSEPEAEPSPARVVPARIPTVPFPFLDPEARTASPYAAVPPLINPVAFLSGAGQPTTEHLRYAEGLTAAIPAPLQAAAREPLGASTILYALLLSEDEGARQKQLEELAAVTSPAIRDETVRIWPTVRPVASHARLPLVDLALPGLRHLSPAQFEQFRAAVQTLVESDGQTELFEYVLQKIVLRHLEPHFVGARKPVVQYYAIKPLAPDCAVLLSALAYAGQNEPERIEFAFQQGARPLCVASQTGLSLVPAEQCGLAQVDAALDRLAQAVPQIKRNVLLACAQTVAADQLIQELEAELLRAISDTLDCPIPPFISAIPAPA